MDQISGALVGIALVLSAVFVPAAFLGGSTGVIYRQFSVTIVSAMVLSVMVALTLTPALCATMLKAPKERGAVDSGNPKSGFFGWFNRVFERNTKRYHGTVNYFVRRSGRLMLIYVLLVGVMVFMYTRIPTSYLPQEDQGILFTMVQLPANSTRDQTLGVMKKVENYLLQNESESVRSIMSVLGFSFSGNGQKYRYGIRSPQRLGRTTATGPVGFGYRRTLLGGLLFHQGRCHLRVPAPGNHGTRQLHRFRVRIAGQKQHGA